MLNFVCKNCVFINGNIKWVIRGLVLIKICIFYFFKRCILKYIIKDIYNFNVEC